MKYSRKTSAILIIAAFVLIPVASQAQFGFGGIVYDPTNYHNAVLRYVQLQEQLAQLTETYKQVWNHYQLALQMSKNIENMPARYRAGFSEGSVALAAPIPRGSVESSFKSSPAVNARSPAPVSTITFTPASASSSVKA